MSIQQIFLSYCHRDDEPYGPQNRRWVEEFETALRESIGQRLGPGRVELWRDTRRLAGNEMFDDQIGLQLDRSAIFVTVLSQHYLSSTYCQKEFQTFGRHCLARGDLRVDQLSRIVKVYRRAIDRAELRRFVALPELIREVDMNLGYELYYKDDSGIDRDVLLEPNKAGLYWQRADDIAYAIKRMLDAQPMSGDARATRDEVVGAPTASTRTTVYLARTSSDMKELRESLHREFEDRGYRVLPEQELPEDAEGYVAAVKAALSMASLSVHLIGARYGSIPDGAQESGVVMQAELALAQKDPLLKTILWSPPELTLDSLGEERQHQFVEQLEQAAFKRDRAEFVRSSIEQLKPLVVERLRASALPAPISVASTESQPGNAVYLLCDPVDRTDAKPLQAALIQLGFVVSRPSLEGTTEELIEENRFNLVNCDLVVVVWGQAREAWVRSKLRESQQAPGWGRNRPYRGKFIIVGPPNSPAKLDFDAPPDAVVVRGVASAEQLRELLQ